MIFVYLLPGFAAGLALIIYTELILVLLNASGMDRRLSVKFDCTGPAEMSVYDYTPDGFLTDENSFPLPTGTVDADRLSEGRILVTVPARSFKMFTNIVVDEV